MYIVTSSKRHNYQSPLLIINDMIFELASSDRFSDSDLFMIQKCFTLKTRIFS